MVINLRYCDLFPKIDFSFFFTLIEPEQYQKLNCKSKIKDDLGCKIEGKQQSTYVMENRL